MVGFVEGRYPPEVRTRHRVMITTVAAVGVTACVVAGFTTSWPMGNALASSALIVMFAACFWWMFGSKKSGPVGLTEASKYWGKRTIRPWRPRK